VQNDLECKRVVLDCVLKLHVDHLGLFTGTSAEAFKLALLDKDQQAAAEILFNAKALSSSPTSLMVDPSGFFSTRTSSTQEFSKISAALIWTMFLSCTLLREFSVVSKSSIVPPLH
jgi:hypothetical protein